MEKNELQLNRIAEIKLSYHPLVRPVDRPKVSDSREVYQLLLANWDLDLIELQEQFKIILLNRANQVIGISEISKGGMNGTVVDTRLIFGIALKACASAIVLAHNHPSGNLKPSAADLMTTKRIVECGKLLELDVFDHLIVTPDGYLSMMDDGLI
jgi:DNA repair protein RadC